MNKHIIRTLGELIFDFVCSFIQFIVYSDDINAAFGFTFSVHDGNSCTCVERFLHFFIIFERENAYFIYIKMLIKRNLLIVMMRIPRGIPQKSWWMVIFIYNNKLIVKVNKIKFRSTWCHSLKRRQEYIHVYNKSSFR